MLYLIFLFKTTVSNNLKISHVKLFWVILKKKNTINHLTIFVLLSFSRAIRLKKILIPGKTSGWRDWVVDVCTHNLLLAVWLSEIIIKYYLYRFTHFVVVTSTPTNTQLLSDIATDNPQSSC